MQKWILLVISLLFFANAQADKLIIEPDMGRAPLLAAMTSAEKSIDLVIYGFTDQKLLQGLLQQQQAGKRVAIILEGKPFRAESENRKVLKQLLQANIKPVTAIPPYQYIHQKTLILDNKQAWVMTFNFTQSTFKKQRNFALVIDNPRQVAAIKARFLADSHLQPSAVVADSHLVWSPDNSRSQIIDLIASAHKDIAIYAQNISDAEIIKALTQAAQRKVSIKILSSAKIKPEIVTQLKSLGVAFNLQPKYYIHAKAIIIDKHTALIGSINFTRGSLDDNRELAAITEDMSVINQLLNIFNQDFVKQKSAKPHTSFSPASFNRSLTHWLKNFTIK